MSVLRTKLLRVLMCCLTFSFFFSFSLKAHNWVEHKPGGDTRCARGEEFSFFVHEGSSDKIVVDFIGGGACWNGRNCSTEGATFVDSVDVVREYQQQGLEGIYDHSDSRNPVKDWTHVIIPYCTGDIHWGENDVTYTDKNGDDFTIHHRGATNTKAVLQWLQGHFSNPEKVFVTGCSAGSYGSIYWTPHLRKIFPNTKMTQLGDSGTGVITEDFLQESLERWASPQNAPSWIPGLDPRQTDWRVLGLNDYYKQVSRAHPDVPLNQFSYSQDETQRFFHELMGGNSDNWPEESREKLEALKAQLQNFDYLLSEGAEHCILPYNRMHTDEGIDGRKFSEWLKDLL